MRILAAATLLISALSVAAAPLQPLAEVGRVPLEPPFEDGGSGQRTVRFHPDAAVGYAASRNHLFAFDATTGADLGRISLASAAGRPAFGGWELTLLERRLLAWSYSSDGLALVDLDEPAAPRLLETAPGTWEDPRVVAAFDDGIFALRHGHDGLDLVATDPFRTVSAVPHVLPFGRFDGVFGPASPGSAPVLAVAERTFSNPPRRGLAVYDVAGGVPVLRFWREDGALVRFVLPDRAGEILIAAFDAYEPVRRSWVETIDAWTGEPLASWDVGSDVWGALAEGGGRHLLLVHGAGIDVVDLEDPGDPRPVGRIEVTARNYRDRRMVAPSDVGPVVFVTDETKGELVAFDPRSAAEIARLPVEGGIPIGVVLQEPPDGIRRGTVIVRRDDGYRALSRGGRSHLELADLTNPGAPRGTGRFLRNEPGRVDQVRALGGRHVLVYEIARNALALVDLSEGRVSQVTGASALLGEFETYEGKELRTSGRIALVAGPRGWERFALVRGRLETLDSHVIPRGHWEGLEAAELTPKGTVVALGWRYENGVWSIDLETKGLDGRTGRIPRVSAWILVLDVSPLGELVAVSRPDSWGEAGMDVYDVSDPSSPSLLWTLSADVSDAVFDPTGTRLLVSGPLYADAFQVRAFDARTGAALGPPSPDIVKFAYHGFGTQWIAGGAWRAIYWKWTWSWWENALVDLSGPEPVHLRTYTYTGAFPEFAPRDGGGWYEVRRDPWNERTNLIIGGPGGELAETGVIPGDHGGLIAVRRGFVATVRRRAEELGIFLWRDLSLVAPPVPKPRGDRELEHLEAVDSRLVSGRGN